MSRNSSSEVRGYGGVGRRRRWVRWELVGAARGNGGDEFPTDCVSILMWGTIKVIQLGNCSR